MKKALIIGAVLLMVSSAGTAQSLDANPGITPDSPFYFMDRAFDRFRSSEAVADEKAAEVVAMAKKRNEVALSKAENSYSRAMERRMRNMGSESSEEVFNQTAKHMEAFSSAANATDSETITGLKRAMNSSARKMGRAFDEFNRTDPDRAKRVAERTLQRVMEKAPEQAQKIVFLRGHFKRPGSTEWRPGMRLDDVVTSVREDLLPNPDMDYALIKREVGPKRKTKVFSVDLGTALHDSDSEANVSIQARDTLYVFSATQVYKKQKNQDKDTDQNATRPNESESIREIAAKEGITSTDIRRRSQQEGISPQKAARQILLKKGYSQEELEQSSRKQERYRSEKEESEEKEKSKQIPTRRELINPIIQKLYQQAHKGHPAQVVQVQGKIRSPGEYPLEKNMRVSDLIRAGNGLKESAYSLQAELTRYEVKQGKYREVSHHSIDLAKIYQGNTQADLKLKPHDRLYIQKIPQWQEPARIELRGEVRFPGSYSISRGDTLTQVIERAGGLTNRAYPQGAVFTREKIQEKEQERLDRMTQRLQKDLAKISMAEIQENPKAAQGYSSLQDMLDQLRTTKAVGRLTLDLPAILAEKQQDVAMRDGDELYIPTKPQEVTVMGEVQFSTSHLYKENLSYEDYIQKCGGTTSRADLERTYIIHASGEVERPDKGWFSGSTQVNPGDTIIVPLNVDYIKPLDLVSNVSQILYQLGVAAASWSTVTGM